MPQSPPPDGAEIHQDLPFQQRLWKFQRIAWGVMAAIAVAALLGLFGTGPLDEATAGREGSPLWLEFNRFGRLQSETSTLKVHLGPHAAVGSQARFWLGRDYLESIQIQQITPRPESVEAGPDRDTFVVRVSDPSRDSLVTLYFDPEKMGPLPGRGGLEGGKPLTFSQFIYP